MSILPAKHCQLGLAGCLAKVCLHSRHKLATVPPDSSTKALICPACCLAHACPLITGLLYLQVLPRNNLSAPALASMQQGQAVDRQVVQAAVDTSGKVLVTVDVRPAPANHARRGVGEIPVSLLQHVGCCELGGSWGCVCAAMYERCCLRSHSRRQTDRRPASDGHARRSAGQTCMGPCSLGPCSLRPTTLGFTVSIKLLGAAMSAVAC